VEFIIDRHSARISLSTKAMLINFSGIAVVLLPNILE
jgi:hypothetical protein